MIELRRITERYRLEKQVASSDAGNVFRGTDIWSGETVAVKLISGKLIDHDGSEQRERFLETARALQSLRHPGVPQVIDFGFTTAGSAFLVAEYLQGSSFEELAGSAPARVLALLLLLVDGLEAMARAGISTRNLRAENLLVVPGAAGEQVKILGLGSAALEPGAPPLLGGYPEDLRDFGLLACRMLRVQTDSKVAIPPEVAAELKDAETLRALLDAALRGDPEGLYPSYQEVRQALRQALFGPTVRRPVARTKAFVTPPGVAAGAPAEVRAVPPGAPSRRRLSPKIGVPMAALLLVGIALALVLLPRWSPPPLPKLKPKPVVARPIVRSAVRPIARPVAPPPVLTPPPVVAPPPVPAPPSPPFQPQVTLAETHPGGLAARRRKELARGLARALEKGDLRLLRTTAGSVPAAELASLPPAVQADLARARRALESGSRLARAEKAGDSLEVIRQATALLAELPRAAGANDQRERAARAIENAANTEIFDGQYDAALDRLNGLRQAWPDRPGQAARLDRLAAQRKEDQDLDALLAAVSRCERDNQPLEGLKLLAGAKSNHRYAERFQAARQRLEAQFVQLDRRPPELALRVAAPVYRKGTVAIIPLRITDDFGVTTVEAWARPEKGRYAKVGVRHLSGSDYALEVPPELHRNATVEYYAIATDASGHAGQLGSAEHPLKMRRQSWLEWIFGKG